MQLNILPTTLAVCKLATRGIPEWAVHSLFLSLTHTAHETSLVCEANAVPPDIQAERNWRGLEIDGTLDFSMVGVIAKIAAILEKEQISIFVISTYNTDYILVRTTKLEHAILALETAGYLIKQL